MTRVKICGITNLEDALLSAKFGADALGFNFYKKSPRYIASEKARAIIEQLPPEILKVGVFVNEDLEKVVEIAKTAKLDALQLHGEETPAFALELKAKTNLEIIKAFRVSSAFKPEDVLEYDTDAILLDAYSAKEHGGTGETFDWEIAKRVREIFPKMYLAGGLSSHNIADAILQVQPFAVDTCSGIEKIKGKKDGVKVKKFFEKSSLPFPKGFAANISESKFLNRIKKKAVKNFSWSSAKSLENASNLSYWLLVFDKENESLEVCEFLSKFQFNSNFNLWSWIEHSLALQSRIYRKRKKLNKASHCIDRIISAGFVKERLDGLFVEDREKQIKIAILDNDKWATREWIFLLLIEICILSELGGSSKLPIEILEMKFTENLQKLRKMLIV